MRGEGNVILLHDAGGDRSETVAALPKIIDYLQARGDRIVPLAELLGMTRDELMPPVDSNQQHMTSVSWRARAFASGMALVEFFWAFMIFSTGCRGRPHALLVVLAGPPSSFAHDTATAAPTGPRSVSSIAAYNEGKVIAKTYAIAPGFRTTKAPWRLLITDDGSSRIPPSRKFPASPRSTSAIVRIAQPNRGKAVALSRGVARASHEIVVFLDADTLFERGHT